MKLDRAREVIEQQLEAIDLAEKYACGAASAEAIRIQLVRRTQRKCADHHYYNIALGVYKVRNSRWFPGWWQCRINGYGKFRGSPI